MTARRFIDERVLQTKDSKILGTNIKEIRMKKGLKQIDVITKLQLKGISISSSSYTKLEQGLMNPKVTYLIALVDILGCDFNDLFVIPTS